MTSSVDINPLSGRWKVCLKGVFAKNERGYRGGCQQLSQQKGAFILHNKKEALSGLIQVNDDEERKGGQAGRVYGCQL